MNDDLDAYIVDYDSLSDDDKDLYNEVIGPLDNFIKAIDSVQELAVQFQNENLEFMDQLAKNGAIFRMDLYRLRADKLQLLFPRTCN